MTKQKIYIVCYDIVENRKRNRASEILKDYGIRVQKSVFECRLDEKSLPKLFNLLQKIIDKSTDSIRGYLLCESCRGKQISFGNETVMHEEDFRVI